MIRCATRNGRCHRTSSVCTLRQGICCVMCVNDLRTCPASWRRGRSRAHPPTATHVIFKLIGRNKETNLVEFEQLLCRRGVQRLNHHFNAYFKGHSNDTNINATAVGPNERWPLLSGAILLALFEVLVRHCHCLFKALLAHAGLPIIPESGHGQSLGWGVRSIVFLSLAFTNGRHVVAQQHRRKGHCYKPNLEAVQANKKD